MNGLSWPMGLFAITVGLVSLSSTDFPAIPVVGTLTVLWGLIRVVEKAKQMAQEFKADLVTEDQLKIKFLEFEKEMRQEVARAIAAARAEGG